ncbi:MAG: hypothetical protein JKY80_06480 [Mariprofundaceae bacterium]|nr:hypothetical protein [Mariprofundaceae bacterium]
MITSPVSHLPIAARSYLTAALVLMLVLIAVHFSIQAWSQQQARLWVTAWEKQYGGHVGEVRLHMLRGALTIREIKWKSADIDFRAPFVLLRGNLSDSIEHVDIREVVLQGAKITISNELFQQILQEKPSLSALLSWTTLLDNVKNMHSDDMDIVVQAGIEGALPLQPLTIHHVNLAATPQRQQQWKLSGDVWGGSISVSSQNHGQKMTWSKLDAVQLTKSLGLSAIDGTVAGQAAWKNKQLSGDIVWQNNSLNSNKKQIEEGNLGFQGVLSKSGWQGDIQTLDWPLQLFSGYMPVLHERALKSAYVTGLLQMKRQQQGWQASMDEGVIRHLDYSSESKPAWYLQHVAFKKARLTWPQRTLRMDDVLIEQGSWAVDSTFNTEVSSTSTSRWKVNFPNVSFKAVKLGDIAKHIWLPDMQGKLSLHGRRLNMKASSDSEAIGLWTLQAQGFVGENLNIKVQAKHVPLLNFRDALPQMFVENARLNGDVSLDLGGVWNTAGWQLQGDMSGQDIMWNRGAWLWRAEHMQLENIVFGSTQMPHVDTWQVHNWAGQTSLTPWSQVISVDAAQKQPPLSLNGWKIKHINIGYGKFSLGQEDAVWLESDMIKFDNFEQNQVMNMRIKGRLADGNFTLKGEYFLWGRTPWVTLHARLKHALPFAAAPWLQLSGLPKMVRGRISADIKIDRVAKKPHHYQGLMQLKLSHGQLQNGVSSNKMLSEATGYEAHGLFDRINNNGDIELKIPLQGNWIDTPLSSEMLERGLLSSLADKAMLEATHASKKELIHLSNIRLHDSFDGRVDSLKHNERVRLRKVIHVLKREKKWVIELQPQLGQEVLSERLIQRVRKTQEQIIGFLVSRGISPSRIFPVWPEEGGGQGESTGILIQAVK